jgi:hypothetical protein
MEIPQKKYVSKRITGRFFDPLKMAEVRGVM